ncbi:hypothetical protein [Actinoplanes awajinensis]|uniref:Uncharacterized protein n=1 Tax=Actinoplanes awajinensis subsp. mycoplanecinus TaxID=135947 RepID=A0A0X3V5J2_9ACTN|nr:hypothetical protein [Actinoplanes awajinensis]KUL39492.1 hypothetical protein ADL15_09525 [Actinoplanes awajinensis subsp. mycoplanecinus]
MSSHEVRMAGLAEAVAENRLVFDHGVTAELPPVLESEPKVTVSLRLDVADYERVRAVARAAGIKPTRLMRDWILAGLAGADDEKTISVADLLRAVAAIAPAVAAGGPTRNAA